MAYNTDPRLLAAIREQPAHLQPVLLATTWVESGGRTDAVGDGGRSHGAYQEYDLGRGSGIPIAQRRDPYASTQRAAREFQQYYDRGARGGQLAARAQRPANQGAYAQKVQSLLDDARRALGGQATSTERQDLSTTLPSGQQPQQTQGADIAASLAQGISNRRKGESLSKVVYNTVISAAMQNVGQAAVPPEQGYKSNPQGNAPDSGEAGGVVAAARRWIGTPYSWGGGNTSGPTGGIAGPARGGRGGIGIVGFDCSSLVQNAWAKVGVQLPRTTYDQIKYGRAVPTNNPNQWRPGDLMFPSTGHVQMYIGNGKVIEAPRTGGHVQIVPVRNSYIAVRRPR